MEELKALYEERKMAGLAKACEEQEKAGNGDFAVYAYYACAEAARNNFSRLSLQHGIELFEKAAGLCPEDARKRQELYDMFTKEVMEAAGKSEEMMGQLSMTPEITQSYRDCMRLYADALMAAVRFAELAGDIDVLPVQKEAVSFMVRLCAVRRYEVDMGKNILKKVDNAPDEIRKTYGGLYDELTARIKEKEPDYTPEEIQRERVDPAPPRTQVPEAESGQPGKKSLIDRILDFF